MPSKNIYPQLIEPSNDKVDKPTEPITPSAPPIESEVSSFRLTHITSLEKYLETECEKYGRLRKRYKKAYNALHCISTASNAISLGTAVTGVSFLATGVLLPLTIGMESGAVVLGFVSLTSDFIAKKIMLKVLKNETISCLASSKLSSIHLLISKALADSHISDSEFEHIQNNVKLYKDEKRQLQSKTQADLEELKKEYFEKGKQSTQNEIANIKEKINNLIKPHNPVL